MSVFRINRSCKPANPAFTCQRTLRNRRSVAITGFEIMISVVTANLTAIISELACNRSSFAKGFGGHPSLHCEDWPATRSCESCEGWWSRSGSNRRPQACKARALPTELRPRIEECAGLPNRSPQSEQRLVGPGRVERPTSRLSGVRSNHLSYEPVSRESGRTRSEHDGRKGNEGGGTAHYV